MMSNNNRGKRKNHLAEETYQTPAERDSQPHRCCENFEPVLTGSGKMVANDLLKGLGQEPCPVLLHPPAY